MSFCTFVLDLAVGRLAAAGTQEGTPSCYQETKTAFRSGIIQIEIFIIPVQMSCSLASAAGRLKHGPDRTDGPDRTGLDSRTAVTKTRTGLDTGTEPDVDGPLSCSCSD